MNTLKSICLLFALISTCSAYQCKKLCIFDNVTCVTTGGFNVYKHVVYGVNGFLAPLDPLHIDKVEGVMESVQYSLTNITMVGLKHCTVTKVRLNVTTNVYRQYLHCPKLTSHFHFDAQENSNSPVLQGKGEATVVAYDYDILNYGQYGIFVNQDHKPHFFIKSHDSMTHLNGKLEIAITKAHVTDTSRVRASEDYMNKNCTVLEDFLHTPIVKRAMSILIHNIDLFLRRYTLSEVIPEHNMLIMGEPEDASATTTTETPTSGSLFPSFHFGGLSFRRR